MSLELLSVFYFLFVILLIEESANCLRKNHQLECVLNAASEQINSFSFLRVNS